MKFCCVGNELLDCSTSSHIFTAAMFKDVGWIFLTRQMFFNISNLNDDPRMTTDVKSIF